MNITPELLATCFPSNKDTKGLAAALNEVLPRYDITSKERIASFLSQCGHESGGFTKLRENLNYSAQRLTEVWPSRFPSLDAAKPYDHNPQKIANKVYAGRFGNGDETSGDGFKFSGRGAIQLTFKSNYEQFAKAIGKSLEETVAYCETMAGAIESACWFWNNKKINPVADTGNVAAVTKMVNGGNLGLAERDALYKKIIALL